MRCGWRLKELERWKTRFRVRRPGSQYAAEFRERARDAARRRRERARAARWGITELDRKSAEIARGLLARGAGKGSRVGFIYGNGPGFAIMLAAIARIGAIAIPISTMIRANELVRVLREDARVF